LAGILLLCQGVGKKEARTTEARDNRGRVTSSQPTPGRSTRCGALGNNGFVVCREIGNYSRPWGEANLGKGGAHVPEGADHAGGLVLFVRCKR